MSTKNSLVQQIREFLATKRAARDALLQEQTRLSTRRSVVLTAPLNEADFKTFLFDYIDSRGVEFIERADLRKEVGKIIYPPRADAHPLDDVRKRPLAMQDVDQVMSNGAEGSVFANWLPNLFTAHVEGNERYLNLAAYFYFGEQMKAALSAHFPAIYREPPQTEGVAATLAERRAEVAEIDARLADISSELRAINADIDEATAVPPDPEKAERARAAAEAEREAQVGREAARLFNGNNEIFVGEKLGIPASTVSGLAFKYSRPGVSG